MRYIDTVNRCMPSGNENATEDMTRCVAGCDQIRSELGCAVFLLHHTGWDESRERGSTVLRGAMDTLISLKGTDVLSLSCEKQRDLDPFADIKLRLVPRDGSVVLRLADEARDVPLSPMAERVLTALRDQYDGETPVTSKAWEAAADTAERTFTRTKKALVDLGRVEREKGRYRPA